MIEVVSIKESDTSTFSRTLANYRNQGWEVVWQGVGANGSHYSSVYMFATLERELPDVYKTVES